MVKTLTLPRITIGDFVEVNEYTGIVVRQQDSKIDVCHFENGRPGVVSFDLLHTTIRRKTKAEMLSRLSALTSSYAREAGKQGLPGAIAASKEDYLKKATLMLKGEYYVPQMGFNLAPAPPMTGVYVAMGIYSGQGPSEHLEGIISEFKLPESEMARLLTGTFPEGFARIPKEVNWTKATSHGDLVNYWVWEIPSPATYMVKNPIKLSFHPEIFHR